MKKIFLLFAFAIAALCTINVEARQTDESPDENENAAQRRDEILHVARIIQRQNRRRRVQPLRQRPLPAQQAFVAPAADVFFEAPVAPDAPLRPRRIAPGTGNAQPHRFNF